MGGLWQDTHPEVARRVIEGYARMTTAQKAEQIRQLTHAVQQLAYCRLQQEHPGASERELLIRLAELWYGPELVRKAAARLGPASG